MRSETTGGKRRVWVALVGAVAITMGWWVWTRARPPVLTVVAPAKQPFVRITGAGATTEDRALRERAELMDPTPLFFPTEWNYGQRPLDQGSLRQPGQVFGSFAPQFPPIERSIKPHGDEGVQVPGKLEDVLVQGNEAPLGGMGQIGTRPSSLPVRSGYLEVRGFKDSQIIISQQLSGINPPRADFASIEFLILVGSAGLIGEPVLTSGSGWDEIDVFFRNYLVKTYRLGQRLRPGQYRVVVGA